MNKDKLYKIKISAQAINRLDEHFEFLSRISKNAANKLLKQLLIDISSLKIMPNRNPIYERAYAEELYRYKLSCKRYRIVYQIKENIILIDDIQNCRQNNDDNS